jgi:hypothetical protein
MYLTTNYLGIRQGGVRYLFYLLTQDYIESNTAIQQGVAPLLEEFARDLAGDGALVVPFAGTASDNLSNVTNALSREFIDSLHSITPALLILDRDLVEFNPQRSSHLIVSLRESMDEYGRVKVFEIKELLDTLTNASREDGLFERAKEFLARRETRQRNHSLWESVQLQPNFYGLGMDIKAAIEAFRR